MKIVLALWQPALDSVLGPDLRHALADAGATLLQVNVDDAHIPDAVLRLQQFDDPLTCVLSVWTDGPADAVVEAVRPLAARLAAWQVDERVPLAAPLTADGERLDGLAQVAFLRRPAGLPYDDWRAHWQGPHTQIALETQATFGYVQNRVVATLADDTAGSGGEVAAIVEELFPTAAMHDIHAYYGSGGSDEELTRRMTELMASVATMGADHDLDVVATSRYVFELGS